MKNSTGPYGMAIRNLDVYEGADLYQTGYGLYSTEDRLFFLKIQETVDELIQIVNFTQELKRFWLENRKVLRQIHAILIKFQSGGRDKHTKIVHVIEKYLNGIRNFLSNTRMSIVSYKKLFESALIAITKEVDSLETKQVSL